MQGLLGAVFRSFGANLGVAIPIAALVSIPELVAILVMNGRMESTPLSELAGSLQTFSIILALLGLVMTPLASGAITYAVVQSASGKNVGVGTALGKGFSKLGAVLLVGLLSGLCIAGGFLALVIPGIIIAIRLSVSTPAAVAEDLGASEALKRSWALTKPYASTIFGTLFVIGIINFVETKVVSTIFVSGKTDIASLIAGLKLNFYVSWATGLVVTALGAVAGAVIYMKAREATEGVSADALAAVFD
jgi:hypothetical protein